jgi:hypothetical protein
MDALLDLLNSTADALAVEWDMRSEALQLRPAGMVVILIRPFSNSPITASHGPDASTPYRR